MLLTQIFSKKGKKKKMLSESANNEIEEKNIEILILRALMGNKKQIVLTAYPSYSVLIEILDGHDENYYKTAIQECKTEIKKIKEDEKIKLKLNQGTEVLQELRLISLRFSFFEHIFR